MVRGFIQDTIMAITVTAQFKAAFDLCVAYYEVTGDELKFETDRVRQNYEEASKCYMSIASGLINLKAA